MINRPSLDRTDVLVNEYGPPSYVATDTPSTRTHFRLGAVTETILVAALSFASGWADTAFSAADGRWAAAAAAMVGVLLFAALEQLRAYQDTSREAAARGRALRAVAALVLAAGLLFVGPQVARHFPCKFAFTKSNMLYCTMFDTGDGWNGDASRGTSLDSGGSLQVSGKAGYAMWMSAPYTPSTAAVQVSTRAKQISDGAGAWGVWCRGNADGSRRYEFTVTSDGHAYIKISGETPPLWQVDDWQSDESHTVSGVCRDLPGTGVELILSVDGHVIGRRTDTGAQVLGPGRVGVYTATFGDVSTSSPVAAFDTFMVTRDHRE